MDALIVAGSFVGFAGVFGFTTVLGKLGAFSFMPKDKLFMWNRSIMSTVNALYASVVGCYALAVMAKMNDYSIWKFIMNSSHLHIYSFANKFLEVTLGYFLFDIILSIINKERKFIDYFHHVVCSLIFIIAIKTGYTVEMCTTNLLSTPFMNLSKPFMYTKYNGRPLHVLCQVVFAITFFLVRVVFDTFLLIVSGCFLIFAYPDPKELCFLVPISIYAMFVGFYFLQLFWMKGIFKMVMKKLKGKNVSGLDAERLSGGISKKDE